MKKLFIFLCVIGLIFSTTSSVFSAGVDNKTNYSAEFIRTLNRNAATDSADIAVYNPAGIMKMDNGSYVSLSLQYSAKDYSNTINGVEFGQDEPSVAPGLFGIYKKDRWAAFAAFTIPSGGGEVDYQNGNATTMIAGQTIINAMPYRSITNQGLQAESYYLGYTLGGAYEINKVVSVSLSARYINATKELNGSLSVGNPPPSFAPFPDTTFNSEYEETADHRDYWREWSDLRHPGAGDSQAKSGH